jgi:hypothetical protein
VAIDQVADLLVRWRGAGGVFGRGRVLREGIQLLAGLDADERRMLARSLAEQGAPDLANRVEQRTGRAMSADQLWSVTDGLLALEDHQVDRLATSLRDPDERERLARQVLTHGVASFDGAPTPEPDPRRRLAELPPPGTVVGQEPSGQEPSAPELGSQELGSQELGGQELGGQELGGQELGSADLQALDLLETGLVDIGLHDTGSDDRSLTPTAVAAVGAVDPSVADDDDGRDLVDRDPTRGAVDRRPVVPVAVPLVVAPEVRLPSPATGRGEGASTAEATALVQSLREAETATIRLRVLADHGLAELDGATALEVLDALPDGWQRRRAAERLVDAGTFPTDQLTAALARFARPMDALFVAGALVAAGQVRAERFDGILPERVVRRLIARSER